MHAGSLATIGYFKPKNLYHIIFDNESHDSTGGQPTVSKTVNFVGLAKSVGYKDTYQIKTRAELLANLREVRNKQGPQMIVVKIKKGSRDNLGRPTTTPIENKEAFMENLKKNS